MEKYGFVYIWFDRKHKRYYIGCRWGNIEDSYICSSGWMNRAYKKRSGDFTRKILSTNIKTKKETLEEEYKWLSKIKDEELGKRYYNLRNKRNGHWSSDHEKSLTVSEKISKSHRDNPNWGSWHKNKARSEETKKKISDKLKGKPIMYERSEETRQKISENNKRLQKEKRIGMHNKKHNENTLKLMSKKQSGKNNPMYGKTSAIKGKKKYTNGVIDKMYFEGQQPNGWLLGSHK